MALTSDATPAALPPASPEPDGLQAWQVMVGGLCGLVLSLGLARFAYTPLLPVLQAQTGLDDAQAGLLAAVNYAGYMAGALAAAWIESPRWRQRLYGLGLWAAVLSTAACGLGAWWPGWMLLRLIGGLCGATGLLLGSGLVLGWLMRQGRRPELGVHFIGVGLGIVVSAVAAGLFTRWWPHWQHPWWALGAVGALFLWPAWRWRPPVPPAAGPSTGAAAAPAPDGPPRRWWALLALAYFAAGWGFVVSATFTVTIVERVPALAGQGTLVWAGVGVAAMPAVAAWDRVAHRLGDTRALRAAYLLQTLTLMAPAASDTLAAAWVGALGYGATSIGIVSMTLALVGRHSPANPGKAMARLTLSYGSAQVLAPALTGWMALASGSFHGGLWLTAAVMGLGCVALAALPRADRRVG
ncbi:YbfB/YjiJ family MFS transporter [Ideonella livida]|uniref:YbfB/YjiJ family MFS transporter n=1 Tax=Ideonella livida TaxID=2707176 RepID=A0A7C9TM82_9BURK|nr:YbfB/YjiJ family MFS transporter [Ideonella livida]NDY94080.1 YbfB/YjiJ family MFS transporter [Ideonella livida]